MTLSTFFSCWLFQNCVTVSLLALAALLFWHLFRREVWRCAFRKISSSKSALVSAGILGLYLLVAVLDSIGWRAPIREQETGQVVLNAQTGKPLLDHGRSALDYLLLPLTEHKEVSYSAPLAKEQFGFAMASDGKGGVQRIRKSLRYPGTHLLGTDVIGMDVLVLSLKSIRTGIVIGFLTTLIAVPFALVLGLSSGYFGGIWDAAVQFVCTLLNSIPTILFVGALMLILGRGLPQLCLALGISSWTTLCRLVRGEGMRLREADFVQASMALGVPSWKILMRHLLPNVMHIVLINLILRFSGLVLTEATLTYLGLGVGADTMSWGTMINDARTELTRDPIIWWKLSSAFLFMLGLVLPANIFGDAVRDALDPRLQSVSSK